MNRVKDIIFLIVFLAVLIVGFVSFMKSIKDISEDGGIGPVHRVSDSEMSTSTLFIKDIGYEMLIANTPETLRRGLSGRALLPKDTVMFFVFDGPSEAGIWMKDMFFPIDILWLDGHFRVVHIVENASPESFPKVFRPNGSARYVIEANVGFVAENGVTVGDEMNLTGLF